MAASRVSFVGAFIALTLAAMATHAQQKNKSAEAMRPAPGDWPSFNRDLASTRFSPLTQINTRNVARLKPAWSYKTGKLRNAVSITGGSEVTPIVVGGVMYLTTSEKIVALEADTGKEVWIYQPKGSPSRRAVAYWPGDDVNPPRVIYTYGRRLPPLNAATGKLHPGFADAAATAI